MYARAVAIQVYTYIIELTHGVLPAVYQQTIDLWRGRDDQMHRIVCSAAGEHAVTSAAFAGWCMQMEDVRQINEQMLVRYSIGLCERSRFRQRR